MICIAKTTNGLIGYKTFLGTKQGVITISVYKISQYWALMDIPCMCLVLFRNFRDTMSQYEVFWIVDLQVRRQSYRSTRFESLWLLTFPDVRLMIVMENQQKDE